MNIYERWVVEKEGSLPEELFRRASLGLTSLKQARKIIEKGCCSVNGALVRYASRDLVSGDSIEVYPLDGEWEEEPCTILYEDKYLFVINKPAGVSVDEESMKKALPSTVSSDFLLVHRLDKWTSGALIVAKDPKIQHRMELLFRERKIKKEYLAIVDGVLEKQEGSISLPLEIKRCGEGEVLWGIASKNQGLDATTLYRRILRGKKESLLHVIPKTGRTHQIRVHMAKIGHPLLGDVQYAASFKTMKRPFRHMLHALKVVFRHPFLDKMIIVLAPIPKDFQKMATSIFGEDFERKLCEL
jgi:RluA family pseudouridine synthase